MQRKLWRVADLNKNAAAELAEYCGIDPTLALLLVSRGILTDIDAEMFLSEELDFFDPFLIADMDKAVSRIKEGLMSFEKMAVFGDYDADGITSTAVLYRYLASHGANVTYHIPDRQKEGYGISEEAVQELSRDGVTLIITVDNGISAFAACEKAKKANIDVVITDHHRPSETLPAAYAVLNPHRADCPSEYKDFSGVGVVFKLLCALEGGDFQEILEEYGDLIALGTVADIVPLTSENRMLVKAGLEKINRDPCLGLAALKAVCGLEGKNLNASNLGFALAPRINAAGRIGNPYHALYLLLADDFSIANEISQNLDALNKSRQQIEADILKEAIEEIETHPEIRFSSVIVVAKENWHPGVIGIVAARLVSRYGKPAVVISLNGDEGTGSCRSIEGYSMFDALSEVQEHLLRFGGHPGAAGLGIKKSEIDAFRTALDQKAKEKSLPFLYVDIDFKLNPASVNTGLLDTLALLEPFGCENPAPLFGLYRMTLAGVQPVGEGKHLRLTLKKGLTELTAMLFSTSLAQFPYHIGDTVDLAVQIEKNEFRGVIKPSVQIREIRFSENDEENYVKSLRLYEKYKHGDTLSEKEAVFLLPSREFLLSVYRFIQLNAPFAFDAEVFCKRSGCKEAHAGRVLVALDVLLELQLLEYKDGAYRLPNAKRTEKADLQNSEILKGLKEKGA